VAYRADIEIGVKGADRLKELQERVTKLSRAIDDANVKTLIDRKAIQSVAEYSAVLGRASDNLREAVIQLTAAGKASGAYAETISQYVTALGQANTAQATQNRLITDEIELRRKAKLAAAGIRETTGSRLQGPSLEQQGPASLVGSLAGQKSPVAEKINQTLQARKDEIQLQAALLRLEEKSAAVLNEKLDLQQRLNRAALAQGKTDVEALSTQVAQRQQFLAGKSGTAIQGPLAGPGAMGFPVALALSKVEQAGLETAAKKQAILKRMVATKQDLVGLAANLQRLEQNAAVAIADAARSQDQVARKAKIRNAGFGIQGPKAPPSFLQQLSNPSSKLGSAVIGGGFPALMGGGPGTIAGGAIGGLLGGFAGSIGGSAIGQFLDTAIQKVQELGNAINTLNFDKVAESGVRLTGELRTQLDLLVQVGQAQQAQERLSQEVASVTGTPAGTTEDISNAVNLLNAAFNSVVSTVSTLLGIIGAPFVAALAAALGLVSLIAKGLNVVLGFVGKLIKDAGEFVVNLIGGEDAVRNLERSLAGVNGQFDEAIAKANQLRVELNEAVVKASQNLSFERRMTPGSTAGEKLTNNDVELEKKLAGLTTDRSNANKKIREENALADLAVPGTVAGLVARNNQAFDLLEKTEKLVAARKAESIQIQENTRLTREAARAAEKAQRQAEELANLQGQVTLKEKLFDIDKQIAVEKERGSLVTAAALEMDKALEERQSRIAKITRSTADTATKNAQIKDATLDADQKIYAVQQAIKEQEAERTKSFDAIIADLNLELALKTATTEQERERLRIEAARAKLQADLKGQGFEQPQIDQITGLQAQVDAPLTDVQKIDQHIGKLKDEIADLTSISNIAITAAEGIGNAFAQSFQGLISGSMTAKEALGSFFKSVADMFLEMAAQIIAKQITMIILQTILKALGGGAFSGGTSSAVPTDAAGWTDSFNTKLPGITSVGKIGFAKGGAFSNSIVSSPTLFKFADGGTTRTGLMGEAGPEAIMPLKRGADGSLGVQANGLREAMGRPPGGANGSPVLNMSFQSTSINGVEYVSRDQLESAMAETRRASTRDGAKRGMTMTLDRIQNSSSTRRKVGI
jgi:lambda family phage tail tape measure protein